MSFLLLERLLAQVCGQLVLLCDCQEMSSACRAMQWLRHRGASGSCQRGFSLAF